jgi:hypothetical protein
MKKTPTVIKTLCKYAVPVLSVSNLNILPSITLSFLEALLSCLELPFRHNRSAS